MPYGYPQWGAGGKSVDALRLPAMGCRRERCGCPTATREGVPAGKVSNMLLSTGRVREQSFWRKLLPEQPVGCGIRTA